ncbi:MAG: hypothetical protein WCJ61_16190 [Paludibacter sp.]
MSLARRAAYLRRCITVVNLLNEHETDTSIRVHVFEKHIKPVANISYVTLNNMLNESNPAKELEKIECKMSDLKLQVA